MSEQKSSPADFGPSLQRRIYGTDAIDHYQRSKLVSKFLERWAARRLGTSRTYRTRLANLSFYVYRQHDKMELDSYVELLKGGKLDVYDELADLLPLFCKRRYFMVLCGAPCMGQHTL